MRETGELWKQKMRKKIVSAFCALALILGLIWSTGAEVEASDSVPMLDGSYLTHETESIGQSVQMTRGANLQEGYSKLVRLGPGVIYAGGTTIADHTVESVQVTVIVERAREEEDEWHFVDGWHKENTNADLVSANKRMEVEGGWYYRVRCTHSADGDMSSSYTDGLYVSSPTSSSTP